MLCSFTHEHYKEVLEYAKRSGYTFFKYKDYKEALGKEKVIFMRHDLDFGLKNSLALGRIERDVGICSTYFVRVHGPYNPFSFENYRFIKGLQQFGHELGLHYALGFADIYNEDERKFFLREKMYIEAVIGSRIHGISSHEPTRAPAKLEFNINDWGLDYNAYSPVFTEQMKYISDSSGRWREGCMCEFIRSEVPRLSILTHPIWWFDKIPLENY